MSSAATAKLDYTEAVRFTTASLLLFIGWGLGIFAVPRRFVEYIADGAYRAYDLLELGDQAAPLFVLGVSIIIFWIFVLMPEKVRPFTGVVCVVAVFVLDAEALLAGRLVPAAFFNVLIWLSVAALFYFLRITALIDWYNTFFPAAIIVFWVYDAIVELAWTMRWVSYFPVRPEKSFTRMLDGLLNIDAVFWVALPIFIVLLSVTLSLGLAESEEEY